MVKKLDSASDMSDSEESDDDTDGMRDDEEIGSVSFVYVGYQDGTIRKWDLRNGNCVLHIDKDTKKKTQQNGQCLIWSLKLFKNYLISGDSHGHVCVWDTRFGTLIKKFADLQADVLAIEVNSHYECVYASGVDSRVISIQLGDEPVLTSIFRGQSHDVKSLAVLNAGTLLSGGVTTDICVYKLEEGGRFND